jgi:hypothetical protein
MSFKGFGIIFFMNRKGINEILLNLLLVVVFLAPRVVDLVKFTAADEPFWLAVGANYYYALAHRELENTVYEYHPAVTTMWIVTGAMLIHFPEYRGLMNRYLEQEKTSLDEFLIEQGRDPLDLLWWSRFLQLLVNTILFLTVFHLLKYMFDQWTGFATVLLASCSPYVFGQSRMLNHETMVALFSLISVLAITCYLLVERRLVLLILSAAAGAFANLTKSSAIFLLPVLAVIIFACLFQQFRENKRSAIFSMIRVFFSWVGILLLVYFVAWPGMWVAPGKMMYEVYGNAFSYAFQGARLSITQELNPSSFSLNSGFADALVFLTSILSRTTLVTWVGVLLAIVILFHKDRVKFPTLVRYLIAFLFLMAFVCIAMFAVIRGRDQPHYVMTSYYGFEFAAALGWIFFLRWLPYPSIAQPARWVRVGLFALILCVQAAGLFRTYPYYYTYLNPVMNALNAVPQFFYGERMEAAAGYLAAKPDARELRALVYFSRSFSYYFPGSTISFKPLMFDDKALLVEYLQEADYLVIYAGLHERLPLLDELTPETVIDMNGSPYVEIYRVDEIPPSFFTE